MTWIAVRVASGGDWTLCEPSGQYALAGNVYWGRVLARMPEEDLAERGLERAEIVGVPPQPSLGDPPVLSDLEPVPTWAWSPGGLLNFRAQRIREIKAEANRRILLIMTDEQQRNALATGQQAVFDHGPDPEAWPTELQAEYTAIMGKWSAIKAIRTASDEIEAALPTDEEGLADFDAMTDEGWPV